MELKPGAINAVPSRAVFTVDFRSFEQNCLDAMTAFLREEASRIEREYRVSFEVQFLKGSAPVENKMCIRDSLPLALTFLLKDLMQGVAADGNIIVEGVCFLVTSALLLLANGCPPGRIKAGHMSYRACLLYTSKWFTIAAAAALIAAMAATSMAVSVGDIVYEDDDDDYEEVTSLTPGEKYLSLIHISSSSSERT